MSDFYTKEERTLIREQIDIVRNDIKKITLELFGETKQTIRYLDSLIKGNYSWLSGYRNKIIQLIKLDNVLAFSEWNKDEFLKSVKKFEGYDAESITKLVSEIHEKFQK